MLSYRARIDVVTHSQQVKVDELQVKSYGERSQLPNLNNSFRLGVPQGVSQCYHPIKGIQSIQSNLMMSRLTNI